MRKLLVVLFFQIGALLLVACSTGNANNLSSQAQGGAAGLRVAESSDYYLKKASQSSGAEKQEALLLAAKRQLQDGDATVAAKTLSQIKRSQLSVELVTEYQLMQARLSLYTNKVPLALQQLNAIQDVDNQAPPQAIEYHELAAAVYLRNNQPLNSVSQRIALSHLFSDPQSQQENTQALWTTLQNVDQSTLQDLAGEDNSPELNGWVQLAYITKAYANDSADLNNALASWKTMFPSHPGNAVLNPSSDQASAASNTNKASAQNVAVLLPLSGELKSAGDTIRDGFMSAYYDGASPATTHIVFYDTNNQAVSALYQKAIQNGANFVVGPLNKTDVQALVASADISVPTLALNYAPDNQASPGNFYQFGLSPTDEASQIAQKAFRDGHTHAIVIYPQGEWGQRLHDVFAAQWTALGGVVVDNYAYNEKQNISQNISQLLGIDQDLAREAALEKASGQKNKKYIPAHRSDVDVIFLAASPRDAQEIKPLLRFYYAGDIPVYATSSVYAGTPRPSADRDLNDIVFCDMPWLLDRGGDTALLQAKYAAAFSSRFDENIRLFALGMDAYELVSQLNRLQQFPDLAIKGKTGDLYLAQNHQILRRLSMAVFKNGVPKKIA